MTEEQTRERLSAKSVPLSGPQEHPRSTWTAAELMATDFPEPSWAVPGIVAEGVNLLAGPPKIGKSWLSLGLGTAIASGGKALGRLDVEPGPVLYLALEDTPRRLKSRLTKVLMGEPAPHALTLVTACPPLPEGGDQAIADWLKRHPTARLVVIDVLARMRGATPVGMSAYDADYAAVGRAKRLADAFGVALVLVHHVRKASSEDFLNEVSGTNGLAGAADSVLVLKRPRGEADGVLHVTGRDVDEAEYAMAFDAEAGTWRMFDGPALDHIVSDSRLVILRHVREHEGARPKQISEATGLAHQTVKQVCRRMVDNGQLRSDGTGRYWPTEQQGDTAPLVEPSPLSPCHPPPSDLQEQECREGDIPSDRSSPNASLDFECTACGFPMTAVEPGQTTHPTCTSRRAA